MSILGLILSRLLVQNWCLFSYIVVKCIYIEWSCLKWQFPVSDPIVHSGHMLVLQGVLDGKYDDLSEQSFYMVGGIEEVIAKAEKIAKESAS